MRKKGDEGLRRAWEERLVQVREQDWDDIYMDKDKNKDWDKIGNKDWEKSRNKDWDTDGNNDCDKGRDIETETRAGTGTSTMMEQGRE